MTFPQVTISEIIDGPRPVPLRSLNRVACVGTAKKGKYGAFILISTDSDLDKKIGRTTHTGSVGLQSARDEGASDTAFVRVMGAARSASSGFVLSVTAGPTASTTVNDTVNLTINNPAPAAPTAYAILIPSGSNALQASYTVIAALAADPTVTAVYDPSTSKIILMAKVPGLAGNDINWVLTESGGATDLTFSPALGNLSGGFDGPKSATLTAGDLQLVAAYDGVFANTILVKFVPGTTPTQVQVNLVDGDLVAETFTLDFVPSSLINGNEFAVLRGSSMVRGFFNPAGNINAPVLPTTANNGSLTGGSDGAPLADQDYLNALSILSKNPANIIFAPGQLSDPVRHALLTQATNATIIGGLRIAILNAPSRLDLSSALAGTYTTGYDISTADYGGSAVMVAGWATYAGQPTLPELSVSPDGFYAGHLAATAPYISPAARSSSPYFRSIIALDTESTDVAFEAYTTGRLEAIIKDPATGGYHCLNGRTLSSDSAEYYVLIRRMANQIKTDLWFASQPLKSEPKTDQLISSISNMVSSYLTSKSNIGQIRGGQISGTIKTGNGVRLDFQWYPIYPADQIDYGMHRLAVDI